MRKTVITLGLVFAVSGFSSNLKAQQMNSLENKYQKMVTIAANTAVGNLEALKAELNGGLDAGLTVNQVKEILIQMYAYCGFPRSLQGINTFMEVMEERAANGIVDNAGPEASPAGTSPDKYDRGKANLQQLTGVVEGAPAGANAFAPGIDVFLKEHLFADIFERCVLTFKERELATVSALAAMEGVDPMLRSHINMAQNTGWTRGEIDEAVATAGEIGRGQRNGIFAIGNPGPAEWFTGEVYVESLLSPEEMEGLYSVGQVTFMPGGRTYWHTHPIGQTLLVLEGRGWYQERGKPARELSKGSVVAIPKDVEHWHGASAGAGLVHVAISNIAAGSAVTWLDPVTGEQYSKADK